MFFHEGERMITMTPLDCLCKKRKAFIEQGIKLVLHGLNCIFHNTFISDAPELCSTFARHGVMVTDRCALGSDGGGCPRQRQREAYHRTTAGLVFGPHAPAMG